MTTIEERLQTYAMELDAAADRADELRQATVPVAHRGLPRRPSMRAWQSVSIAAVTLALVGLGLWLIAGRRADAPVGTSPLPGPSTAVNGSPSPWYRITAPGLVVQQIEQETCCTGYDVPGSPTVVSWQADGGPTHGLLVLTAYSAGEAGATANPAANATVLPQPDGSVWQFWSYGMSTSRREALAAEVVPGSGLPFVLPDDSMSFLSVGGLGPAAHSKAQTYLAAGAADLGTAFATIDVGSDRGLFRGLASATAITDTTVAGMPAYRSVATDGTVVFDWRSTAGQWASLSVGRALADQADDIAASVVPDQSELLPPGMGDTKKGTSEQAMALADQAAATLAGLGWTATLEESETRTTAAGVDVQWVYFRDGNRRLFIVSGPSDLLDALPDLIRHLTTTQDAATSTTAYEWPRETWLYTAAIRTSARTIIVRSEGTDLTHDARSASDINSVLRAASQWR